MARFLFNPREHAMARGLCTGPTERVPSPGDVDASKRAACHRCKRVVAVTARGQFASHKAKSVDVGGKRKEVANCRCGVQVVIEPGSPKVCDPCDEGNKIFVLRLALLFRGFRQYQYAEVLRRLAGVDRGTAEDQVEL